MPHYVALIWNREQATHRLASRALLERLRANGEDWHTVVDEDGLAVCCVDSGKPADDDVHVLGAGRGVVIGTLFQSTAGTRVIPTSHVSVTTGDSGQLLTQLYWGRYVAFVREPVSGDVHVVRDPTGGMPCHWTKVEGLDVYFQRLEDLDLLGPRRDSINRRFLLGYLLYESARNHETGIEGIENVLAGECVEHHAGRRSRVLAWNPATFAANDIIEDTHLAIRLMRETTRHCVQAWAASLDRVALRLSGGLDSSIVLACLAETRGGPEIVCVNDFIEHGASADERHYARLAAGQAGSTLIERQPSREFDFDVLRDMRRAVCPHACLGGSEAASDDVQFMRALQVQAVFDGVAGDELFCHGRALPTAVDYAWLHGLRPSLARIALDDAEYRSVSYWNVLRAVWRYGMLGRRWEVGSALPHDFRPLVTRDVRASAPRFEAFLPPHLRDVHDLPPGKVSHLYAITGHFTRTHVATPAAQEWVSVSPLCSQPLAELCLRIPLHVLCTGGRDRSIARSAFEGAVPEEILYRRAKGSATERVHSMVADNLPAIRALLLDGFLAREGLIDRAATEEVLSGRPTRLRSFDLEILHYVNIEAWAVLLSPLHRTTPPVRRPASAARLPIQRA
jgi:asparagine synthase (glutamine-hydrolysing)